MELALDSAFAFDVLLGSGRVESRQYTDPAKNVDIAEDSHQSTENRAGRARIALSCGARDTPGMV